MAKSGVKVGHPGEVYVCGGELGPEVRMGQDFVQCGREHSTKCGRVTPPAVVFVFNQQVYSSMSAMQTQILQKLHSTKKSKLMVFDVRRLAELLSDAIGILLSRLVLYATYGVGCQPLCPALSQG